ncbi:hypothetical protein NAP1_09077 [Erythrobacter sp. NAP1]|uniref:hypothetical protein n=1 Tax=Erythrobacter sp. NAP1 TaxID=237727 RepID=UPI0000685260|nr:hypothetical protein [Erythrobacter sp. NAP1]EAQ27734.1 hypothetical protein NAP1_09077 [Erythrobacter sp. NAP1]
MGGNHNLSGEWDGTFAYPDVPEAGPVTPFLARLSEAGGVLSGSVIEPHEFAEGTAEATISGTRIGKAVHFAKTYHGAGWEYRQTVLYYGTLNDDGTRIAGEWRIDHWRGPFEMTRDPPPAVEVSVSEEAEAGV